MAVFADFLQEWPFDLQKRKMITLDLRRIRCAKELQDTANGALAVAKEALTPKLYDLTLIKEMYQHFRDFLKSVNNPHHAERRREFLFIISYLFCPNVLIGGTMPRGFRGVLKDVLHVESPSAISNYTSDLFFLYNHYADFREAVELAYEYISQKMDMDNLMKSENKKSNE